MKLINLFFLLNEKENKNYSDLKINFSSFTFRLSKLKQFRNIIYKQVI